MYLKKASWVANSAEPDQILGLYYLLMYVCLNTLSKRVIKFWYIYQSWLNLNQFSDYKLGTIGASLLINQNVKLKTWKEKYPPWIFKQSGMHNQCWLSSICSLRSSLIWVCTFAILNKHSLDTSPGSQMDLFSF